MATILKGITFPFQRSATGFPAVSEGNAVVADQIKALFATAKGERVMRPTLGIQAIELVFNDITQITKARLAADVMRAFQFWVPLAVLRTVDVHAGTTEDDQNVLYVYVEYSIAGQIEGQQVPIATAAQG